MIVEGNPRHGVMIAKAARTSFDPETDVCLSRVTEQGELLGGFVFTDYTGTMITIHMAGVGGHWCSPRLMWLAFDYPFNQLDVTKMLCTVASTNSRSLDLIQRAGWSHEHRIEDGVPGGDLHLFSMLKEDCKWLRLRSRYLRVNGSHRGEHVHAQA